jgi:hypothetical protein
MARRAVLLGPFSWHSRLAFWIKDRIDRAFLRAYQMPER